MLTIYPHLSLLIKYSITLQPIVFLFNIIQHPFDGIHIDVVTGTFFPGITNYSGNISAHARLM